MGDYNFDKIIERRGTSCLKWNGFEARFSGLDAKDALPMWIADMDFKTPKEVVDAIIEKASLGIYGYPCPKDQEFDAAVSRWLKKRLDYEIEDDWIIATPGVVAAVTYAVQAFTNESDGVIIQTPVYYPFKQRCINYNKRMPVENRLLFDGERYTIDYDDLEKKASDPNNKLFVLCNPHNPVGRVWTKEELEKIVDICLRKKVLIFSDEIHSDLILEGYKHFPTGKISKEASDILIAAYAPSKTFNLAGLKASAIIIPNSQLREQFNEVIRKNEAGSINIFGDIGLIAAYNHGEGYLKELLKYISTNIKYVKNYVEDHLKGVKLIKPEGTYLIWLDFNGTGLSVKEIEKKVIEEAKVAGDLGTWFGEGGGGFIRLNVACPLSVVKEAMRRLSLVFGK